jgi:two-component system response regulator NreC
MTPTKIFIADDHTIVRQGLRKILEGQADWTVAGEAGDGRDAVRQIIETSPDVAVLDIGMPQLNGIEAARHIARRAPQVKVLILSMYSDEAYVVQALQAGARGYLLKDSAGTDLIDAIQAIVEGHSYFSPAVAGVMLDDYVRRLADKGVTDRYDALSEREREIFQLIAEGRTNKEIADLLFISTSTVETHRSHIMEKLGLHSATEIALYAVHRGIIR